MRILLIFLRVVRPKVENRSLPVLDFSAMYDYDVAMELYKHYKQNWDASVVLMLTQTVRLGQSQLSLQLFWNLLPEAGCEILQAYNLSHEIDYLVFVALAFSAEVLAYLTN